MMSTISDLFSSDPLRTFSKEISKVEVQKKFSDILDPTLSDRTIGALSIFVKQQPFRYWNRTQVIDSIGLLESNVERSLKAISARSSAIDRGLSALYRQSQTSEREQSLNLNEPRDLIELTITFMPAYLRWAEYIFSNLIEFYWAIIKKGSVQGGFNIKGGLAQIKKKGLDFLVSGYSDEIRNGIAHGDFSISPFEVKFGTDHPVMVSANDFLTLYDDLVRTCNALSIALLIFWSNHHGRYDSTSTTPMTLLVRLAAGGFDRLGLKMIGAVESNTPMAGKQLHVAIDITLKKRTQVLGECARVAFHLLEVGAIGYDRYVIQVDQREPVASMVTIDPSKLNSLIIDDAPVENLSEAFSETNLLWFNESSLLTRLRSWIEIVSTGLQWVRIDILHRWHEGGLFLGKGRYRIRDVEHLSSKGISRVRIRAVLENPDYAEELEVVQSVISDIVSQYRRKLVSSRGKVLDPGLPIPKFPSYIWVDLFKEDGTLRWLRSGGWMAGNLVAIAEFVRGSHPPVLIHKAEEVYRGIRIRYSMDEERAVAAAADLEQLIREIWQSRSESDESL